MEYSTSGTRGGGTALDALVITGAEDSGGADTSTLSLFPLVAGAGASSARHATSANVPSVMKPKNLTKRPTHRKDTPGALARFPREFWASRGTATLGDVPLAVR